MVSVWWDYKLVCAREAFSCSIESWGISLDSSLCWLMPFLSAYLHFSSMTRMPVQIFNNKTMSLLIFSRHYFHKSTLRNFSFSVSLFVIFNSFIIYLLLFGITFLALIIFCYFTQYIYFFMDARFSSCLNINIFFLFPLTR